MTVPAVPVESILVSHEELNNSRTGNVATVVHDEDVVTPQQRSRPTLSAILRDAKKELPSMARAQDSETEWDEDAPITPVQVTGLENPEPLGDPEPGQAPDEKSGVGCHEEEDVDSYMERAAEGFKRHESWVEAVVEMAMKLQGGTHDSNDSREGGSDTKPSNQGHISPSSEDNSPSTTGAAAQNPAGGSEQDERDRAEALLRTVAAGPLPAAESLWSDDEGCDY